MFNIFFLGVSISVSAKIFLFETGLGIFIKLFILLRFGVSSISDVYGLGNSNSTDSVVLDFVYDFKDKLLNGVDGDNLTGLILMSKKIKLNCKY